jgi:predicted Zn-dependent protease
MAGGESSLAELIRRTRRGVYVRRFHYVNPVDERQVVLTGMTRDGCFLIENGRLGAPLRNLRFTQGVLALLKQITAMSAETRLVGGPTGPIRVPAVKARSFGFTGVSEQ